MIVYKGNKESFLNDVLSNNIENIILEKVKEAKISGGGSKEVRSWKNSLQYMNNVLVDIEIPNNCGIAIEYNIPLTNNRIDFIITGQDECSVDHAILIELKQWETAQLTDQDGVVITYVGKTGPKPHPSYQAWSYATLLQGFNETVYEENIQLKPCAYLHNYPEDGVITNSFYKDYIDKAPLFLKADAIKLRSFIKQFVKHGDKTDIMYRIDCGKIKPSKSLADSMSSMLKGNEEFTMIDEQKIIYEEAMSLAKRSSSSNKNVMIVEGGPGTGKSVVAINLLVNTTKIGLLSQYVTKNAAPRAVYENKLTGTLTKTRYSNMFKGSGGFHKLDERNIFDALIVDEAHRLNEKSGLYSNEGENQIKEIINASKFSIFFVDEDQKVTLNDIGDKEEITKWALSIGANVTEMELTSQFRCNGSNGYLAWLDDILQIKETANKSLEGLNYSFTVVDNPNILRDIIFEKNKINNKARLLAGYCWDWNSKNNTNVYDVIIPEYDFKMQWNLTKDGSLWMVNPESVKEIGCIHTCQGLEADYIGVIVGDDLVVRNGKVVTNPAKRSRMDSSVKGYKKLYEQDAVAAASRLDKIIKNTYRTLMTRGMKGCYVYFTDKETEKYFKYQLK